MSRTLFQSLSKQYGLKEVKSKLDMGLNSKPILSDLLFHIVNNVLSTQGVHNWRVPEENWYSGLGLTYSASNSTHKEKQVLGNTGDESYNCGMQFHMVSDWAQPIFQFFDLPLTPIRSRIAIVDGNIKMHSKAGWHVDESPYETLRLNIPIRTNPNFYFQLDNCLPEHLPTGRAYWWDTQIPHRIFHKQNSDTRIHLVLGFSPWFMLKNGEWVPNEFFNRVHPLDIPYETL